MQNYIKELKFYSNNDFAFLEVHNKELFLKNALVLKEIVELLQITSLPKTLQINF